MPDKLLIVDEPNLMGLWMNDALPEFERSFYGGRPPSVALGPSVSSQPGNWAAPEECAREILSIDFSNTKAVLVVNAECRLSQSSRSACDGLRLVELLRMEKDFEIPILVFGWQSPTWRKNRRGHFDERWAGLIRGFRSPEAVVDKVADAHTIFARLPVSRSSLLDLARQLAPGVSAESRVVRLELARTLLQEEQERVCSGIRHRYQNVLAAHRLLLGAFIAGDISFATLRTTAEAIGNQEAEPMDLLGGLQAKWADTERELASLVTTTKPFTFNTAANRNVLIVDDHYQPGSAAREVLDPIGDFGWQPVHEALLGGKRFGLTITGATSYEGACETYFGSEIHRFDLIILDVDLGTPDKSGLHLLQRIRARDPFVPIVIMTSFDDAEICQVALELQADGFFAKQLNDDRNRSSLDYYLKFVETVELALESSSEDRDLYKKFVDAIPFIVEQDKSAQGAGHFKRLEDGVLGELTKFFLVLRVVDRHHLSRSLLTNTPAKDSAYSYDELMLILLDAILAWLNWGREIGKQTITNFSAWLTEYPDGLHPLTGFVIQASGNSKFRHSSSDLVTIKLVRELAADFLKQILGQAGSFAGVKEVARNESQPSLSTWQGESLTSLVERARRREFSISREHSVKSRMGSEAALLGSYLSTDDGNVQVEQVIDDYWTVGPDPEWDAQNTLELLEQYSEDLSLAIPVRTMELSRPLAITLIDDHARSNGWAYVAQLIHNNAVLTNIEFDGVPAASTIEEFVLSALLNTVAEADLLLLDLRMPLRSGDHAKIDTGLKLAECINRLDPLLPIVLLSAHNESITMRRAIDAGAADFFPKESPLANKKALMTHYARQFSMLPDYLKLVDEEWLAFSGRCRGILFKLGSLVTRVSSSPPDPQLPDFFSNIINSGARLTRLPFDSKGRRNLASARRMIAGQVLWLFRRALFFLSISRDRYLSNWLLYFTSAVPQLRPQMLGYDQVWVNCAMLVEYVFNVVALTRCGATKTITPGKRLGKELQQLILTLGKPAYEEGLAIWDERNNRRYAAERSRTTEEALAHEIVNRCMNFLWLARFCEPSQASTRPLTPGWIVELRGNLESSIKRQTLKRRLRQVEGTLQKSAPGSRTGSSRAESLVSNYSKFLSDSEELSKLTSDAILKERHSLLSHLRI